MNMGKAKRRASQRGALALMGLLALAGTAGASPSGLNNTPTADICPTRTLVLQDYGDFGHEIKGDNWVGFKYGLFQGAEIGADWKTSGAPALEPQYQAKYTVVPGGLWPQLGGGIANVSFNASKNGDAMPYLVLTEEVAGWFRAHAGYGFQDHNLGAFAGLDRTVDLLGRDLMLCGDVTQANDRQDALFAPGVKLNLGKRAGQPDAGTGADAVLKYFVLEAWTTFNTDGSQNSYTLKLDFGFSF